MVARNEGNKSLGLKAGPGHDMSQGCSLGYKPKTGPKTDPNKIHSRTEEV